MKNRTTFTVAGSHPLLLLVRDYFIQDRKFALVPWSSSPDFCLYGAALCRGESLYDGLHRASLEVSQLYPMPTVVLSTSSPSRVVDVVEPHYCVATTDRKALFSLSVEAMLHGPENLVIRPHNVYGPDISTGVIPKFLAAAKKGEPLPIRGHGFHSRCFIHQDDFLAEFGDLLGNTGVHEIGTPADISVNRLADSIWRAVHGPDVPTKTETVDFPTKDRAARAKSVQDTGREYISLRKGIWLLLQ